MPTHGEGKIAVFLIDFPDHRNENPEATVEYYDNMYFNGGVETFWGYKTVAEVYREHSYGKLNLSGKVFDWYTAKHERSYYDDRKAELVKEAAEHYIAQGYDFAQFDGDGDGVLDALVYHFAGEVSEGRYSPWYSGMTYSAYSFGEIADLKIRTIVQVNEGAMIGRNVFFDTICHELMHTLGMPDLYSETYMGLTPTTDLMAGNENTVNPYLKMMLGWIDTVQVIKENTENIRLNMDGDGTPGEFAIVTNEFNGLFDEFYLVAYRNCRTNYGSPVGGVVWHIDARLTEDGNAFQYQNLRYTPKPGQDNPHNTGYLSPYPFIEELSGDPALDLVLNRPVELDLTTFGEDSVLGPDSMPSSDTHDGVYTGIRMANFVEHNNKYLTFDVSFVEDCSPPIVTTDEIDLEFNEKVRIRFNEFVYAGTHWDGIQVTDLSGKPLAAKVLLSYYPHNEVAISFETDAYQKGYRVVFPEGCLRDSSGNAMQAAVLTASDEKRVYPIREEQLPGVEPYKRNNAYAHFSPCEDGFVIITGLWVDHAYDAKIEFMRLDPTGKVLLQTIIDNPFEKSGVITVYEAGDGSYIVFVPNVNGYHDRLFCIDSNGRLKWSNDEKYNSGSAFNYLYKYEQGIIAVLDGSLVYILSESGEIQLLKQNYTKQYFNLSDGRLLAEDTSFIMDGIATTCLSIVDSKTKRTVAQGELTCSAKGGCWMVGDVQANDDGTIMLYCWNNNGDRTVFLTDASLNVVKSVALTNTNFYTYALSYWIENDGFYEVVRTETGNHDDNTFRVRRYDRYLNFLWQSDVVASVIHYFKSPSGELMAYRSMLEPERECYIDYFGSEERYRTAHVHSLAYVGKIAPTCEKEGVNEYWWCTDCGCIYADEGQTLLTDTSALVLATVAHTEQAISGIAPTCTHAGLSEGTECAVCYRTLVPQQIIRATGHTEQVIPEIAPTCTENGVMAGLECAVCGEKLTIQKLIYATGHTEQILPSVAPTCNTEGLSEGSMCSVCKEILVAQQQIPVTQDHVYGDWIVVKKSTAFAEGEDIRTCRQCGHEETRLVPKQGTSVIYLVIVGGILVIGALGGGFVLVKKRFF
ncbi:MAG: hypothetical protein IJW99_08155 [Clostridia bacterium]|nr:hypothetical protein [Clostridia bacterium]